ncbi:MAG TPA: glycosyltransferase family 39 protein [Candidatus Hydrogenedentes bacterium]|nr:glycosyltransferase family 39 protein [Candidatus Hydrogenedentota bacterium]
MARWEWAALWACVALSLALGFANLAKPSLWHDELVHIFVAKHIAQTGLPLLPSGTLYVSGTTHNYLLALFVLLFGDGEASMRAPSALLAALNVALTFGIARALLGRGTALCAAFLLATSPWAVAWSREARFYTMQQTFYLMLTWSAWLGMHAQERRLFFRHGSLSALAYIGGVLTALHGVIHLAPMGAYAFCNVVRERCIRSRWTLVCALILVAIAVTMGVYFFTLPPVDRYVVFQVAGFGGKMIEHKYDPQRADRYFYFRYLNQNYSTGFYALAGIGTVLMLARGGRKGLYAALAFWAPLLVLTYFIGYRRYRFMFFEFPFYLVACSYAIAQGAAFLKTARRAWWRVPVAAMIIVFGGRVALSTARLVRDSLHVASGADATLAQKHPQWREPCHYVRARLDGAAVVSTTFLSSKYYVGKTDGWYPAWAYYWEEPETDVPGIKDIAAFQEFMRQHPKGFFLAERKRFHETPGVYQDVAWVEANLRKIEEASNKDVVVYAWGP